MTTTRVLVAHDAGARMFDQRGPGKGLVELSNIEFEDGRRALSEINADRPGRRGPTGHAYEPHEDARTHAVHHFARTLVEELTLAHHRNEFTQIILIAPPRFLGFLRDAMGHAPISKTVIGTLAKDLPRANAKDLCDYVGEFITC
jgi:protein required for attachment to host cells